MDPSGKTFVVTGGGSGLGRACVDRLVAVGANVVVADLRVDGIESGGERASTRQ